jgi:hypothetical protein
VRAVDAVDLFEALTQSTPSFLGHKNNKKASEGLESHFSTSGFLFLWLFKIDGAPARPPAGPASLNSPKVHIGVLLCAAPTNLFHMQAYLWVTHHIS